MAKESIRPIRIEGNVAYVPLTKGYEAVIDADAVHLVGGANWFAQETFAASGNLRSVYAVRKEARTSFGQRAISMHRLISGAPDGQEADHRDGDGLNNRRENLRIATRAQNSKNKRLPSNNNSGCKGVSWHKQRNKWQAKIMVSGKSHHLGLFATIEAARIVYGEASKRLHGDFGRE